MNRTKLASLALVVVMALAGCGAQASSAIKTATSSTFVTEGSLPTATQLVVGTFKLESAGQAVTAEQAQELLPLWKAYRSMSSSSSSSTVELQALVRQMQSAMTEEQLAAIAAMQLGAQDLSALMQEQNIDATASVQQAGSANKAQSNSGGGAAPVGGMEGGAPPDGGGMPAGEIPVGAASAGGQASGTAPRGAGNAVVSTALLDALINMLAAKA